MQPCLGWGVTGRRKKTLQCFDKRDLRLPVSLCKKCNLSVWKWAHIKEVMTRFGDARQGQTRSPCSSSSRVNSSSSGRYRLPTTLSVAKMFRTGSDRTGSFDLFVSFCRVLYVVRLWASVYVHVAVPDYHSNLDASAHSLDCHCFHRQGY